MDQDAQQIAAQKLIASGLLTQNQLTKALEYQCRLPPGQFMNLAQVLIEFEFITEEQLSQVLGEDYLDQDPIGRLLVEQGIVSSVQLEQAMQVLSSFSRNQVTDILIDLGFVTRADIERAVSRHQIEMSQKLSRPKNSLVPTTVHKTSHDLSQEPEDDPDLPAPEASPPPKAVPDTVEQAAVHLPLGRQLIAKGYLSEDELRDAIEYQQRLPRVMHRPIGEILVTLGYINEGQLKEALAAQPAQGRSRIGEILIQEGLIEDWQLAHALSLQFSPEHAHKKLGLLLVELGYARRDEIEGVLARHYREQSVPPAPPPPPPAYVPTALPSESSHKPLGKMLVEKGYITQAQLEQALAQQARRPDAYMPLGDILVLTGVLTESQLQECLAEQPGFVREPLGQILIRQGLLEDWQLAHALCIQNEEKGEERRNLGAILSQLGYCTQESIEAAVLRDLRQKRGQA